MQNSTIVLCGMERSFMQKLALYFKERLKDGIRVGIAGNPETALKEYGKEQPVWVGSEDFISRLREAGPIEKDIIVSGEDREDDTHVFQYQSREKLYSAIWSRCMKLQGICREDENPARQIWVTFTGDVTEAELMAVSMVGAQVLGQHRRVLYVNLSSCCGMKQLFLLENDRDLGDLMFRLRKGGEASLEAFAGHFEQVDYILPFENPMILHEIEESDTKRLLAKIRKTAGYEVVVFGLGYPVCGCRELINGSNYIRHLTGSGILAESMRREWMNFLQQCVGSDREAPLLVSPPKLHPDSAGPHLIADWLESPAGKEISRLLKLPME